MASSSSGSSMNNKPSPAPSTSGSTMSTEVSTAAPPPLSESDAHEAQSKLRTLLGILRKFIGVPDIATVRFSLPAQLLEPLPNLEYWNYLDRPETFISIGDSDDALERLLEVLRFWFTKDLKYVKGKPCKPYNSTLGEFFRCTWDVKDTLPPVLPSSASGAPKGPPDGSQNSIRISYLTEQTSHHPPVSAFYIDCPEKGISANGYDQISAKFTGTTIKVTPGEHNLGIFIKLKNRDNEQYQLTHPPAHLGGFLRGSLSVTVQDVCYVTCPKTKLKAIIHYIEEGWLSRSQHRVEGVIFKYDPDNDTYAKVKDVPDKEVLARIDGAWVDKLFFTLSGSSEKILLVDLNPLLPEPKTLPPDDMMLPNESRKVWETVTRAIHAREFGKATQLKQEIEERQREKAAARKSENTEWKPRFFQGTVTPAGQPDLTKEGEQVLEGLHVGNYQLEAAAVTAA